MSEGRGLGRWIKVACVSLLVAVVGLVLAIALYNQAVVALLCWHSPPPGRLVEVDGHRMHIHCTGTGTPVVVLESGLGGGWMDWARVQPELSTVTQVCSYDRAGMGWSDPGPRPPSSSQITDELDALLAAANVPAPYVLVGHSLGGVHVRVFAAKHPGKVAGLVLLDSAHPKMLESMPPELRQQMEEEFKQIGTTKLLMATGIARLMGVCDPIPPGFEAVGPYIRMQMCRVGRMSAIASEYRALGLDLEQAAQAGSLGALPLLVLSHDPGKSDPEMPAELRRRTEQVAEQLQQELTQLSSRGERVVVSGAGHYIHWDRPDAVIAHVRRLVEDLRNANTAHEL